MRSYSKTGFDNTDIPVPPDTVAAFNMTGGSSAQASDWFSSGSTALTAAGQSGANGPAIVRFTGHSSAGGTYNFFVNLLSTLAAVTASGTTVGMGASSGVSIAVAGEAMFQIPGQSTGYSIAALSSGYVYAAQWKR